jgi:diaminohydroxyphosphoribosylaminopyrimidine deaminase/5-amino-6-(5-phosphoribosylamino)uracil reductase
MAEIERRLMRRVLALAAMGRGCTSPNPLVGAVVAKGSRIVGQGFHRKAGEPHAEIIALREAGRAARGATLYTNLEPCCHTGRTPPCVEEILSAGVERVVSSIRDPDPRVNGGGFRALRRGGVVVEVGLMKGEASYLNRAFTKFVKEGFPFVTLKGAASLDGRIATRNGESKWITSTEAREHARLLRREHDAVLVGIGTVLTDDPRLTARPSSRHRSPLYRVVLDGHLRLPPRARLLSTLDEGPIVVFAGPHAAPSRARRLERRGVTVERLPTRGGRLDLRGLLRRLAQKDVTRLLVEGGGEVHSSFLEEGLADRLVLYLAPRIIGGRDARALVGGRGPARLSDAVTLSRPIAYRVGADLVVEGDLR